MLLHSWPYHSLQPNEEQYHHPGGRNSDIITVLTRRNGGENYFAEPKLFILTNWRFVIGGSLRIFKFMAIYNWRK